MVDELDELDHATQAVSPVGRPYWEAQVALAQQSADAIRAVTSWVLTVPHGTDLQQADRVRVDGVAYEVAILISTDHATAVRARLSRS